MPKKNTVAKKDKEKSHWQYANRKDYNDMPSGVKEASDEKGSPE